MGLWSGLRKAAGVAVSVGLPMVGAVAFPPLGGVIGGAVGNVVGGYISGDLHGSPFSKDVLLSAGVGAVGEFIGGGAGSKLLTSKLGQLSKLAPKIGKVDKSGLDTAAENVWKDGAGKGWNLKDNAKYNWGVLKAYRDKAGQPGEGVYNYIKTSYLGRTVGGGIGSGVAFWNSQTLRGMVPGGGGGGDGGKVVGLGYIPTELLTYQSA
ncbi:hypothetical protein [Nocardia aurantia]|uniref:Uncharacterized protein n=1 Tax=Nocardia aurantia TaxID=2585199 RepID=A0A7K0DRP6_9NOCA|nr:hypothetical protein [Nocardia aurantia]MQY28217.1 hypothetical protein [Nocardia aurantia]